MSEDEKGKAFIALPCYTDAAMNPWAARRACLENGLISRIPFAAEPLVSSVLPACFNALWAKAIEKNFDLFFMLHGDIVPEADWAGKLWDIMLEYDADVVSALSPVKSDAGVYSAGIGNPEDWFRPLFRFTTHQVHNQFPETFTSADIGWDGWPMVVNTGCWVANLRKPWVRETDSRGRLKHYFEFNTEIVVEGDKCISRQESEDWAFSRMLFHSGCKVMTTRAVTLNHFGSYKWSNQDVWGSLEDHSANDPAALKHLVHEHGFFLDSATGAFGWFDKPFADAVADLLPAGETLLDIGCGRGDYVEHLRKCGRVAEGVDGSPVVSRREGFVQADLAFPINGEVRNADWVLCLEVGEHIPPEFADTFLENVTRHAIRGVILSWAEPGQGGRGHVNCQPREWVRQQMEDRGFRFSEAKTSQLQSAASVSYLRRVQVFQASE